MTFFNEFGKKWASEGSVEPISETQKKSGWDFLGSVPPISGQFNLVQQNTDEKINYLFNLINSFVISKGGTLNAVSTNALRDILNNLLMAVQGGHVGYATKDGMLLDTTQEERTIAEVLSDPVAENNGFYLWLSGEWVKQIGPWGLAMSATDASRIAAEEAAADADAAKTEAQTAAGLAVEAKDEAVAEANDIRTNWQDKLDAAAQYALDAEEIKTEIRNWYYGPLEADPVTRPDGTPVQVGDEYHSTVSLRRRVFNGSAWEDFIGASTADLANATDPAKGAGMVGRGWQAANSIVQLRTLRKNTPAKYAEVFGYYSAGDGGGGLYYLDESDMTSTDNGGTVIVASDGGRWKLNHRGFVSARQFGAVGDGMIDDTVPLQKSFDYVAGIGATLVIDSGTYRINKSGRSSIIGAITLTSAHNGLRVVGSGAPIIRAASDGSDFYAMFTATDVKNMAFEGIEFDANGTAYWDSTNQSLYANGYSVFYFKSTLDDGVDGVTFTRCKFKNTGESAIVSYGSAAVPYPHPFSSNIRIMSCDFENIGAHGIGMNEWRNSSVSFCRFKNVGMKRLVGVTGSGMAVDVSAGCEDVIVVGCTVDGAGGGFKSETHVTGGSDVPSRRIRFIGNSIRNLWQSGRMAGEDFSIYYGIRLNGVDCEAADNVIDSYSNGLVFGPRATGCSAKNNPRISSSMAAGILFENSASVYGGNQAIGNRVYGCLSYGINLQGYENTASDNHVSGSGSHGIFVNYAVNAKVNSNRCYNNADAGIKVQKKTVGAILSSNQCHDTRVGAARTQTHGISVSTIYDEAAEIQLQGNDCHNHLTADYSASHNNTYSRNHLGFKEVYAGTTPIRGIWTNGDRVVQSFQQAGRPKAWACTTSGGASIGTIPLSAVVSVGAWYKWDSGTTVWEVTIAGTTAASSPDIAGKIVGDTVVHGTSTLTLRSTASAAFTSEGSL